MSRRTVSHWDPVRERAEKLGEASLFFQKMLEVLDGLGGAFQKIRDAPCSEVGSVRLHSRRK